MVSHSVGITGVSIKDFLEYRGEDEESYHPDLVEAANTTLKELVRKYNGVPNETNKNADDKPQA